MSKEQCAEYRRHVEEATAFVARNVGFVPRAAVVLGSGLGSVAEAIENPVVIPYGEIPHWPLSTAPGHKGRLVAGHLKGVPVVAMQGRLHYYEGYSMREITFPVRVFGGWGTEVFFATNASGASTTASCPAIWCSWRTTSTSWEQILSSVPTRTTGVPVFPT